MGIRAQLAKRVGRDSVVAFILETERLQLRELEPTDLDFVATMLADPEVNRYYERQFTREDSEGWLNRQLERYRHHGHGLWLVQTRDGGEAVGQVGLAIQQIGDREWPEVGWLLHRPYWGCGYATEAGAACRDAAFERWQYPELISLIRPVNERSQRVAFRLGLKPAERIQFHGYEHIVFRASAVRRGVIP